jgi:esterase/lipase superfamily enzyme
MPRIDAQFRTIPGRAHRAIGGLSAGGYSAMAIAARHPDLFVSAAAFSGVVDIKDRGPVAQGLVEIEQSLFTDMQPDELFRRFGNPYTSPLSWAERNPADLARNLRGMQLFVGSGDGVPADTQDVATGGAFLWQRMLVEEQVSSMARHFVEILEAAAVPVTYRSHPGTHEARHWRDDLAAWWPLMMDAVDSPPPSAFDYRRADERFSVWRWTFAADPVRAAEFLDISGASRTGVTLTGSGIETVTTAPAFRPGERVALTGAQARSTVAGRDGRLRFTVDLGPAHQAEQGTPQAAGQTFLTRTVRFRSQAIAGGPRA